MCKELLWHQYFGRWCASIKPKDLLGNKIFLGLYTILIWKHLTQSHMNFAHHLTVNCQTTDRKNFMLHLGKSSQTLFHPPAATPPPPTPSCLHLQKFYNYTRTGHIILSTTILSFLLLLLPKMHSMDK